METNNYEVDNLMSYLELDKEDLKFPDCPDLEKISRDALKTKARAIIDMNIKLMDQKSFVKPMMSKIEGSISRMI